MLGGRDLRGYQPRDLIWFGLMGCGIGFAGGVELELYYPSVAMGLGLGLGVCVVMLWNLMAMVGLVGVVDMVSRCRRLGRVMVVAPALIESEIKGMGAGENLPVELMELRVDGSAIATTEGRNCVRVKACTYNWLSLQEPAFSTSEV